MSTTFNVYPGIKTIPTFDEIIDVSTQRLHERLKELNIKSRPAINAHIEFEESNKPVGYDLGTLSSWENIITVYFNVGDIPYYTGAHFVKVNQWNKDEWMEEDETDHALIKERSHLILSCLENGHWWFFRRSVNQPPIINLAYGLIAVSLAELTNGYVYSSDGGWDTERFPATPEEFDSWYFRPEMALDPEFKEWAAQCLNVLTTDITSCEPIRPKKENIIVTELLQKLKEKGIT